MDTVRILSSLGFDDKEAAVYIAMLELGMAPASMIARKARLKRPTTYEVLGKLCGRGLAECFLRKKLRTYAAISPVALREKYAGHLQELTEAVPQLMAVYNALRSKPRITFYEGKEELRRLYLDVLNTEGEALNYFLPAKPFEYFGEDWVYKHHIAERVRRGIRLRVIMPQSAFAKRYVERKEKELRETRVIQGAALSFTNETFLYGDKMSTFSFDEDFALLIESPDVVRTQKTLFELAWRSELVQ